MTNQPCYTTASMTKASHRKWPQSYHVPASSGMSIFSSTGVAVSALTCGNIDGRLDLELIGDIGDGGVSGGGGRSLGGEPGSDRGWDPGNGGGSDLGDCSSDPGNGGGFFFLTARLGEFRGEIAGEDGGEFRGEIAGEDGAEPSGVVGSDTGELSPLKKPAEERHCGMAGGASGD